jgi:glycosyltransferase involved in cell wall biosynthesis
LTEALRRVMSDDALRRRMGDAAWAAAALLPSWDDTARDIAEALKAL